MSALQSLMSQIQELSLEDKRILLNQLLDQLIVPKKSNQKADYTDWKKYRGVAKNVWKEDAQEYVKKMRNEEREVVKR